MKNKKISGWSIILWIGIALVIILLIYFVPKRIDYLYLKGYRDKIEPNTFFSAGEVFGFAGAIFDFVGTVTLGIIDFLQNKKLSDMNERLLIFENQKNMPVVYLHGDEAKCTDDM